MERKKGEQMTLEQIIAKFHKIVEDIDSAMLRKEGESPHEDLLKPESLVDRLLHAPFRDSFIVEPKDHIKRIEIQQRRIRNLLGLKKELDVFLNQLGHIDIAPKDREEVEEVKHNIRILISTLDEKLNFKKDEKQSLNLFSNKPGGQSSIQSSSPTDSHKKK